MSTQITLTIPDDVYMEIKHVAEFSNREISDIILETITRSVALKNQNLQFELLKQIDFLLTNYKIPYWLRGGWALDFLLGRITRPHSDIDLICWSQHKAQLIDLFTQNDFNLNRDLGIQTDFHHSEQEINIGFISQDEADRVFVQGIPMWQWLPNALTHPPKRLNGLTCPVLSPAQLLEEKEGYERGTGRPLRPKDHHSIALLSDRLK